VRGRPHAIGKQPAVSRWESRGNGGTTHARLDVVGFSVWGKENSHIEGLINQVLGRTIVDAMMMFQIYLRGGTISGRRDVGPHGVNL
jgi:hypothetical protein